MKDSKKITRDLKFEAYGEMKWKLAILRLGYSTN